MSLTDIFLSYYPQGSRRPKNLRDNAREYADYAHGLEPDQGGDHAITNQHYGRSSGSNN